MEELEKIENLILNENAYFYKKIFPKFLKRRTINRIFIEASEEKLGKYLLEKKKEQIKIGDSIIELSVGVFKYRRKPSFIKEGVVGWDEIKLAYLVLIDFVDYLVIAKRNVSDFKELKDKVTLVDYKTLSSLFINDSTSFEKFSMHNLDISDNTVRSKSVEATDLKQSLSAIGLNSYVLSNLRIATNEDKLSLSLGSSRINKFGNKNDINYIINWACLIVDKIKNFNMIENFTDVFATPVDFQSEHSKLKPIAILFILTKLYDEFEANHIHTSYIESGGLEREIDLFKHVSKFARLQTISQVVSDSGTTSYKVNTSLTNDLKLVINQKSITLRSEKLKKIRLKFVDDTVLSILDFFNRNSSFIVNFDEVELVYTHRKLFRDNRLLGNIDHFLEVFQPHVELKNTLSEKGNPTNTSKKFPDKSIFQFIEDKFLADSKYFVCDDMGREWADYISIKDDSIAFYHAKWKGSQLSASDLQDIIGQAQKNLGNIIPQDNQLDKKHQLWENNYAGTQIKRLRKGSQIDDAINEYKRIRFMPNLRKQVYIVVNFISKSELKDRLQKLKKGEDFKEKNEVIQILWFVSSLISSCHEVNVETYIICKP